MNKPAMPSKTLLEGKEYVPANKTDLRATFERLRTADYFPRESDGMDGDARPQEERQ